MIINQCDHDAWPTKMIFLFVVILGTFLTPNASGDTVEGCDSPQYLEIGSKGVLNCFFNGHQLTVIWCNTTGQYSLTPIMKIIGGGKRGKGYISGEYDMYLNGSLIINEVSIEHEQTYTAIKSDSPTGTPSFYKVIVVTTVKPDVGHPVVDQCKSDETSCFIEVDRRTRLRCHVQNTRPAVDLMWYMSTSHEKYFQLSTNYTDDGITYTSENTITDFLYESSLLSLLVCRGNSQPPLLQQNEVFVLTENINTSAGVQSDQKMFELGSKVILSCSQTKGDFTVWKKSENLTNHYTVLAFAAFNISKSYYDEYKLTSEGSLIIHSVKEQNVGFYQCTFQNDVTMVKRLFHVNVYVPVIPLVTGCIQSEPCILPVTSEGTLHCCVTGIRERVNLEWKIVENSSSPAIIFTAQRVVVSPNGDSYDVCMTSHYQIHQITGQILKIKCQISGQYLNNSSTTVHLVLTKDYATRSTSNQSERYLSSWQLYVAIAIVVSGILTVKMFLGCTFSRLCSRVSKGCYLDNVKVLV
ncbi:hypothetical protein HOLleu_36429 [Holothuria leucospilota]|uniref:Ig-like domain-containing protein n=1 Tax=Holothuria leucospilota TaxID=206669 RepID=A0A9Q0YM56_HOLLE|nr:hypothetical protein HOLleu_36429 [Holothuria leucospilota]